MKIRYFGLLLAIIAMTSCDRQRPFNEEAALAWSKRPTVQSRQKASSYSFQRSDESWVSISTAEMTSTDSGLMYSGEEILDAGFLTYPGGLRAASIQEAIAICSELTGAKYQANKAEMATPRKPSD